MAFKRRWQPNATQRKEYSERMRAIEAAKTDDILPGYDLNCTGDCCTGDEIAFFNAGKAGKRLYGVIVSDSYGADKQQHTFTIECEGQMMLIKGRNLYANGVLRKVWPDEQQRAKVLDEKHERGGQARKERQNRINDRQEQYYEQFRESD